MADKVPLNGFEKSTKAGWLKIAGRAAEDDWQAPLDDGIRLNPLYTRQDYEILKNRFGADRFHSARPFRTQARHPWQILQLLDHLPLDEANRQLRDDLANGASGVILQLGGNIPYGGAYIGARSAAEFRVVFEGVDLGACAIHVSGGFDALPGAAMVVAAADLSGADVKSLRGSAGLDPVTIIAASGYIPAERGEVFADAVDAAHYFRKHDVRLTPFLASGRVWHQSGGSAVQELAYTLSATVAYWRALETSGFGIAEAIDAAGIVLAADADLFLTIAKFRAARLIWQKATEACGANAARLPLLMGEMSFRMITGPDPYVNMLRATAAVFGAAIGGADAIVVIPFNTRTGTPDAFARRMARNTQLILAHEAHLGRVSDEAGGAWYVEHLTHQLAACAWAEFQSVEAIGGILAALESGMIGDALLGVRQKRERRVATAQDAITGVSSFPDLNEKPVNTYRGDADFDVEALNREDSVPDLPEPSKGERFAAMIEAAKAGASMRGLERALERLYERRKFLPAAAGRLAEPFERLRRASDMAKHRIGARPPVFVATLGAPADFTARLTWIKSFFEAGGFEVHAVQDLGQLTDLEHAFRESPAPVACLCSSDAVYRHWQPAPQVLKDAGAAAVYVAIEPAGLGAFPPPYKRAIDRIIYPGCDMLSVLEELQHIMRVEEMGSIALDDDEESG